MDNFSFIQRTLKELKATNLLRTLVCADPIQETTAMVDNYEKIVFCSNNYLNLANHPKIKSAVIEALNKFGYGATASRLISGTTSLHLKLERQFADFFNTESALLFPSGFSANQAILKTIPQKGDLVLIDKLDHASIIDAAKAAKAKFHTYRRDNTHQLEKYLADNNYNRKFIVTESVFSMDGDVADLKKLLELKKTYNAILIVDEAHALGCLGKTGAGLAQQLSLLDEIDIIVAPMGKGFAGAGAIVAAKKVVIDYLINKAREFVYTTAPPPVNCAALLAALEIVKTEPTRRKALTENADYLRKRLNQLGLDTANSTTHIIPVIIGDSKKALAVSKELFEKGFLVTAIRPPTVPAGSARLRISVQCEHKKPQLDSLAEALGEILKCKD